VAIATFAIVAVFLWGSRREGPDFGLYLEWGHAAVSGDVFELDGEILSRGGVPFSVASAAPGVLFATAYRAHGGLSELRTAAYVTGWAAALLFWVSAWVALRAAARGHDGLAVVATAALFVGTPVGLYSHTYSSEVLASAFVAACWGIALSCRAPGVLASAAVAAFAGLLLFLRPYLVLYAVVPLWLVVVGSAEQWRQPGNRRFARVLAAAVPLALAVVEAAIVNRWMTGSPFRPAYVYGGFGFQSVDLRDPQIAAVLVHPWRGLFTYHPLFAVALAALAVRLWRAPQRMAWATLAAVVFIHLWIQSAWYSWWLGSSFGMRGLAPAALPLMVALVTTSSDASERGNRQLWWVRASLLSCVWSAPLLFRDGGGYLTWAALLNAQTPAAVVAAAVVVAWIAIDISRAKRNTPQRSTEIAWSGCLLLIVGVGYLILRTHARASVTVIAVAAALGAATFWLHRRNVWNREVVRWLACATAIILFAAQAAVFVRLALRTEQRLSSGAPAPREFRAVASVPLDDLPQLLLQYSAIRGFEAQKRKLRGFINWLEIDTAPMAPADRDLSERVLLVIAADPLAGSALLRVSANNGVIRIARGEDATLLERDRAAELARRVPGVVAVETTE
jgi:hypothetical protein